MVQVQSDSPTVLNDFDPVLGLRSFRSGIIMKRPERKLANAKEKEDRSARERSTTGADRSQGDTEEVQSGRKDPDYSDSRHEICGVRT